MLDNLRAQAGAMGMSVLPVVLQPPEGLAAAFSMLASEQPDALHLLADSANLDLGDRIAAFAIEHRLPLFATWTPIAELGGLLAYGAPRRKLIIRAGYYVKRILDGVNPGDLAVEQPTEIELWINLKTAKAIGIDVPFQLRQLAQLGIAHRGAAGGVLGRAGGAAHHRQSDAPAGFAIVHGVNFLP
jgi:putative tryptophan/tyrosine transport system substrate-binding protein